ncbi:hypothetical protein V2J09_008632 [Rumex salicifolius]
MAIPFQNSLAVVAVAVVGAWIWSVLEWVWFGPKRLERRLMSQQGIGGHPYRLFHGDMKDVRSMGFEAMETPMPGFSHHILPRIRPFLHRNFINHGKVCVTWEGPVPMVNVADADLVKQILSNHSDFQKPKPNPLTAMLVRGVVSYDGPNHAWSINRNGIFVCMYVRVQLMVPAFYTCCGETLSFWDKKVSNGEHEIDVCSDLTSLSADSISRAAFGSSYREARRIFQLIRDQIFVTVRITQSVYFPGRRYLPTEENKKMKAIDREIRSLLRGIIDKRKTEEDAKDDLLGLLMDSHDQNDEFESKISKQKMIRITTDELIDECKLFYLAGQETTSTLLMWTLILLSKHQDWQAKARQEVLNVFGTNKPEFDGLNHLKIMNMIFHEVLRLYPPVVQLRRRVDDNMRLGNLTLPKGAIINLSVIHIHHDPVVWGDDVNEFNPERFSQGISHASKGNVSFLAFGWGPRICLGSNFAMIEAKVALSMILQRFTFQLSPSYVHAPLAFGILRPQFGAPIIFNLGFHNTSNSWGVMCDQRRKNFVANTNT